MTIELLKPIDANGEIIPEGKIITISDHETAKEMIRQGIGRPVNLTESSRDGVIYRKPFPPGSLEAGAESPRIMDEAAGLVERANHLVSLADTMDEILRQTINEIQAGGTWKTTLEVREIEDIIDRIYREVLSGTKAIEAFKAVCLQWKSAGAWEPETRSDGEGWDESTTELIKWFLNANLLPQQSFSPAGFENILNPEKYYEYLKRDIEAGPKGPRSRYGALRGDLERLKTYCERRADA